MQPPINTKNIFSKIEEPLCFQKQNWEDIDYDSSIISAKFIIDKANKSVSLIDYLQSRYVLEHTPSSTGWLYKTFCPFHKHGNERTCSFFINSEQGRFYCQACSVSGGIVEFISRKFGRPSFSVAQFILKFLDGKIVIESEEIKKSNDIKKFNEFLISLSDVYRAFIQNNRNDDDAIIYIIKCMNGLDNVLDKNKQSVQNCTQSVLEQVKLQLKNYNIKKGNR